MSRIQKPYPELNSISTSTDLVYGQSEILFLRQSHVHHRHGVEVKMTCVMYHGSLKLVVIDNAAIVAVCQEGLLK